MNSGSVVALVVVLLVVLLVVIAITKSVQIIPQAQAAVIERLGRYKTTQPPGICFLVPFFDKIRARIDLREQVVSFPPQPVITEDNLTVSIDTVVYFQVTDPKAALYEINNYIIGVEQLTTTTLRNVVGGMSLEQTLTSRDQINGQLRGVLDEATGRWGIRVARVELKAIDPPPSIQDSMEKQMRADREKRAMILTAEGQRESSIKTAEGQKQSQILSAEGAKQAAILAAEAERQSRILRAQGERAARYLQAQGQAKAIEKVFAAIKAGKPTPELLAYQYLQTLPQMAQGEANKVWLVPSDFGRALEGFTRMLGAPGEDGVFRYEPSRDDGPPTRPEEDDESIKEWFDTTTSPEIARVVAAAEAVARQEVPPPGASFPSFPSEPAEPNGGRPAGERAEEPARVLPPSSPRASQPSPPPAPVSQPSPPPAPVSQPSPPPVSQPSPQPSPPPQPEDRASDTPPHGFPQPASPHGGSQAGRPGFPAPPHPADARGESPGQESPGQESPGQVPPGYPQPPQQRG